MAGVTQIGQVVGEIGEVIAAAALEVVPGDTGEAGTKTAAPGGKYDYRLGRVIVDRAIPVFFDSRAQLYVVRADWQFIRHWDAMLEARLLDLPDAGDRRSGFLTGVYRHLNDHIKVGIGYNFTDFSDDLTNLGYTSHGLFINAIGKI